LYFSGRVDEAHATFARAVQLAHELGNHLARRYALGYQALIAAEAGQLADAEHRIRRATGSSRDLADGEHFVNAIVSLAAATVLDRRGDSAAAVQAAEMAISLARKGAGILEVAKALIIKAQILERIGDHKTAAANRSEAGALLRGRANAAAAHRLLPTVQTYPTVALTMRNHGAAFCEEPTPKEHEVLRMLATRLSRREIGQQLYVSLNTVKTHQRALYRKLAVENRAAAVTRARQLGLL
jgi:LuxR family maltose regulon positive regulatory protein